MYRGSMVCCMTCTASRGLFGKCTESTYDMYRHCNATSWVDCNIFWRTGENFFKLRVKLREASPPLEARIYLNHAPDFVTSVLLVYFKP